MECGLEISSKYAHAFQQENNQDDNRFTVRNITVNNAQSAVYMNWNWGKD